MLPTSGLAWLLVSLGLRLTCAAAQEQETTPKPAMDCAIYKYVGVNDLSVNDIVVKSVNDDIACIKAKFSLAIKVEAAVERSDDEGKNVSNHTIANGNLSPTNGTTNRIVLGYLPLDSIVSVEDTCPDAKQSPKRDGQVAVEKGNRLMEEPEELEMIVLFDCAKLVFIFRREAENIHISAIKGVINLDSSTVREFNSEQPMFFTSDLTHHFKQEQLIEVNSTDKPKAFILTASFYHLEFEAFRDTKSRNFIRPPDEKSMSFLQPDPSS